MQQAAPQHDQSSNMEMTLRDQLIAAAGPAQEGPQPYPSSGNGHHQPQEHAYHHASDAASQHQQHLDPDMSSSQMDYSMNSVGDGTQDEDGLSPGGSRKGKRELSTSKRAAQNRAAQRAFRQRKEGYIKKLEEQVKDLQTLEANYSSARNENFKLREYILILQSLLLESSADFPPAPPHIDLVSGDGTGHAVSTAAPTHGGAEPSYAGTAEQLRREIAQSGPPRQGEMPPPPAPVTAREDPVQMIQQDGISQLRAAAAQAEMAEGDLKRAL